MVIILEHPVVKNQGQFEEKGNINKIKKFDYLKIIF